MRYLTTAAMALALAAGAAAARRPHHAGTAMQSSITTARRTRRPPGGGHARGKGADSRTPAAATTAAVPRRPGGDQAPAARPTRHGAVAAATGGNPAAYGHGTRRQRYTRPGRPATVSPGGQARSTTAACQTCGQVATAVRVRQGGQAKAGSPRRPGPGGQRSSKGSTPARTRDPRQFRRAGVSSRGGRSARPLQCRAGSRRGLHRRAALPLARLERPAARLVPRRWVLRRVPAVRLVRAATTIYDY